jgi:O-antigen/teichoic acid export membrane protein
VLHTATRWVALVAAPPLVLLAVSGQTVLRIFHQPPWPGHVAMLVLAAAFLIDAFTGPVGHVLTMSGRSGLNLATNTAALVCNVALNLVLIPRFGLVGAAVSWAVVIVAVNAVRVIQVRVIFGVVPFERSLARPAIALVGAAALAAFAGFASGQATNSAPLLHLAIVGGTFAVAYGGGLAVLGASADDRLLLRTFLRPGRGQMAVPTTTAAGSDHATGTGTPAITRTSR